MILTRIVAIPDDAKAVSADRLLDAKSVPAPCVRGGGDFEGKAFFLDPEFDWIIGQDSEGYPVLIPTKKEE